MLLLSLPVWSKKDETSDDLYELGLQPEESEMCYKDKLVNIENACIIQPETTMNDEKVTIIYFSDGYGVQIGISIEDFLIALASISRVETAIVKTASETENPKKKEDNIEDDFDM